MVELYLVISQWTFYFSMIYFWGMGFILVGYVIRDILMWKKDLCIPLWIQKQQPKTIKNNLLLSLLWYFIFGIGISIIVSLFWLPILIW